MHKNNIKNKQQSVIKATITNIIVAFMYVTVVVLFIYIFFSDSISKAISLIDTISIQTSKEELKDIKLNLTSKNLENYPEYGTKYGKIKIPSLSVDLPLYFGDTLEILKKGVGHYSGSYFPGEGGSILCVGHNTYGMLRKLPEIKEGAKITIETSYGNFNYEVYETKIVKETDLAAAPIQREKEMLMLYTCYPLHTIGYAPYRFFAYANLVEE